MREVDLTAVRPYADHLGDGLVQMSFTLPVPYSLAARRAALELAGEMGFEEPEVVHYEQLTEGYTYFVMYGRCTQTRRLRRAAGRGLRHRVHERGRDRALREEHLGRTDRGRRREHRLGHAQRRASTRCSTSRATTATTASRATAPSRPTTSAARSPTACCWRKAIEVGADAILVSQTVTQQNLHVHNLTELVEMVEAEGRRGQMILACGGPRVTNELAKELGYDAGFSKGTEPQHLATFIVRELAARGGRASGLSAGSAGWRCSAS